MSEQPASTSRERLSVPLLATAPILTSRLMIALSQSLLAQWSCISNRGAVGFSTQEVHHPDDSPQLTRYLAGQLTYRQQLACLTTYSVGRMNAGRRSGSGSS